MQLVDTDPLDFTDKYNTKLTPKQEEKFLKWAEENNKLQDAYDYDIRGFWKNKEKFAENGHGSDKFKKPNHPTFSDQSIYHGVDGYQGGKWLEDKNGVAFIPSSTSMWNAPMLRDYFNKYEPDVTLVIPQIPTNMFYKDPFGDTTKED